MENKDLLNDAMVRLYDLSDFLWENKKSLNLYNANKEQVAADVNEFIESVRYQLNYAIGSLETLNEQLLNGEPNVNFDNYSKMLEDFEINKFVEIKDFYLTIGSTVPADKLHNFDKTFNELKSIMNDSKSKMLECRELIELESAADEYNIKQILEDLLNLYKQAYKTFYIYKAQYFCTRGNIYDFLQIVKDLISLDDLLGVKIEYTMSLIDIRDEIEEYTWIASQYLEGYRKYVIEYINKIY